MSSGPCAACKHLVQECTKDCVFAPYFPADQPEKFALLHGYFDVNTVVKHLNQLDVSQRAESLDSFISEANARVQDPILGSYGIYCKLKLEEKLLEEQLSKLLNHVYDQLQPQQQTQTPYQQDTSESKKKEEEEDRGVNFV